MQAIGIIAQCFSKPKVVSVFVFKSVIFFSPLTLAIIYTTFQCIQIFIFMFWLHLDPGAMWMLGLESEKQQRGLDGRLHIYWSSGGWTMDLLQKWIITLVHLGMTHISHWELFSGDDGLLTQRISHSGLRVCLKLCFAKCFWRSQENAVFSKKLEQIFAFRDRCGCNA